jgi:hypothetical protein
MPAIAMRAMKSVIDPSPPLSRLRIRGDRGDRSLASTEPELLAFVDGYRRFW